MTEPTEARSIYPKHFFFQGSPVPPRHSGFILIPFAPEFNPVSEAIEAAIKIAGREAVRADIEKSNTRAVMEVILKGIAEAEFIVADMSRDNEGKENMNVYYEVGIAHTVKENVILVTQDTDKLPFDSRHIRHISYKMDDLPSFTEQLTEWIENLPPEPYPDYRRIEAPMLAGGMRREIRRVLTQCKRQWVESIIPSQQAVFQNSLAVHSNVAEQERMEKAIQSIQPEFIRPWQRIERLGFQAIEENEEVIPDLMRALSTAYRLPEISTYSIAGYGPVLALRTWALWGAYAIESKNWAAVQHLLHDSVNIGGSDWYALAEHRQFYHPHILQNNAYVAARIIYLQSEEFSAQYFGDIETMQAFVGVWLFSADLTRALSDIRPVYPMWVSAPKDRFREIMSRIETDTDFSLNFASAVTNLTPDELNNKWSSGVRKQMLDLVVQEGMKIDRWDRGMYLPEQFAVG